MPEMTAMAESVTAGKEKEMPTNLFANLDGNLPDLLRYKLDRYDAENDAMPGEPNVFYGEALLLDAVLQLIEIVKFQRQQIVSLSERVNKWIPNKS